MGFENLYVKRARAVRPPVLEAEGSLILDINVGLQGSSASRLVSGCLIAAAEEARFSCEKHTTKLSRHACQSVLRETGLKLSDVNDVAYHWNTQGRNGVRIRHHQGQCLQRLHRPAKLARYVKGFFSSRGEANFVDMLMPRQALEKCFPGQWGNFELHTLHHHLCHAASTHDPSGFDDAAILIVDGSAELDSILLCCVRGAGSLLFEQQPLPNSVGCFYGAATEYLGFLRNHDKCKVVGKATYGKPRHAAALRRLLRHKGGLRFTLDDDYFDQVSGGPHWYSERFPASVGQVRAEQDPLTDLGRLSVLFYGQRSCLPKRGKRH